MAGVFLSGSLPGLINENTPLWDWIGQLRLSINPALIRFVDLMGFGSNFFDVSLNRSTGMLTIVPIAMMDHEWFVASNVSTTISFRVQFYMADGSVQLSQGTYSVNLLNLDDAPPLALSFASGGRVAAGAAGANIGRLQVLDPDTSSGFTFTIREDDQWLFEMVGSMLKLRAGLSIPLADGPEREVVITVSDGRQSQAFTLSIGVTALGINNGGLVDLMERHESQAGFSWVGAASSTSNLFTMRMSFEIASLRDYGSIIHIQMRDGSSVTVEQPSVIDLLDGSITFSGSGLAGRVWAIYETVLNRDPRHGEMAAGVAKLAAGVSTATLAGELLSSAEFASRFGSASNTGFAEMLYRNSVGWVDQGGTMYHGDRLGQGLSRAELVEDFVEWRVDSLGHANQRAANGGLFVPRSWVEALDTVTPQALDAPTFGLWWAEQIISGNAASNNLPDVFAAAQGILPEISFGASRLQRLFLDMTGMPAESNWAAGFTDALLKRGVSPQQYLQNLVRDLDLDNSQIYQLPQGTTFQAGW